MKKFLNFIGFDNEANLLDSKIFIVKTFIAVAAGYIIGHNNPLLSKDMISILFAMMLTLEPSTITGIRNGLSQITASIIGAVSTGIIIYAFGVNTVTIALSIAFTVYICLKINWREVSPVAIFTAIYMTQYMQKDAAGKYSIFLTFELRMAALITGVAIAVAFNYIFSLISYKDMLNKRAVFLYKSFISNLKETLKALEGMDKEELMTVKMKLPQTFNNIDWVYNLFQDVKKEFKFKKMSYESKSQIERLGNVILFIRTMTHLNYDMVYCLLELEGDISIEEKKLICGKVSDTINRATQIDSFDINDHIVTGDFKKDSSRYGRILHDIEEINNNIRNISSSEFKIGRGE